MHKRKREQEGNVYLYIHYFIKLVSLFFSNFEFENIENLKEIFKINCHELVFWQGRGREACLVRYNKDGERTKNKGSGC